MRFKDWLIDREETVDEGLGRNLLTMSLMGLGAMGATGCSGSKCNTPHDTSSQQQQTQQGVWQDAHYIYATGTARVMRAIGGKIKAQEIAMARARNNAVKFIHGQSIERIPGGYQSSTQGRIAGGELVDKQDDGSTITITMRFPKESQSTSPSRLKSQSTTSPEANEYL